MHRDSPSRERNLRTTQRCWRALRLWTTLSQNVQILTTKLIWERAEKCKKRKQTSTRWAPLREGRKWRGGSSLAIPQSRSSSNLTLRKTSFRKGRLLLHNNYRPLHRGQSNRTSKFCLKILSPKWLHRTTTSSCRWISNINSPLPPLSRCLWLSLSLWTNKTTSQMRRNLHIPSSWTTQTTWETL